MVEPIGFNKKRTSEVLHKHDIDLLIASSPVNVFYLTGIPVLHVAPNPILYVLQNQYPFLGMVNKEGMESAQVWSLYDSVEDFSWIPPNEVIRVGSLDASLKNLAKKIIEWDMADKTIGVESLMPKYQYELLLKEFPNAKIVNGDRAFIDMRLVKSEEEIQRIKKSTEIAEHAITNCIEATKLGVLDIDLLKIARRTFIDEGAEGWDHLTMNIGPSDPEAPGRGIPVTPNDIVRFDFGAVWKGYISDVSRGVVIGEIPKKASEAMDIMIQLQDFCVDNIEKGKSSYELYQEAQAFLKNMAKRGFYLITGHSIGLECEEIHLFSAKAIDIPFENNMVLDIEVWLNVRGQGLVGVEDCYRVKQKGCERLSALEKNLIVK